MRRLSGFVGLFVAVMLAVAATAAAAPASTVFVVTGAETAFSSTSASFSGTGTGDQGDRAAWRTSITRTTFNSLGESSIIGGTFSLGTINSSWAIDRVNGNVAGGFVRKTSGFTGCTNETFAVSVSLVDVTTRTTAGGTGTFAGQLTHYRRSVFGACITYFATINGTVSLTY